MDFRIADTFVDSLTKLTGQEQKAVKTTAFDLQVDHSRPGLQFHKLDRAKDPNFASIRVSRDIRLIVHNTKSSLLLCYVGHHEDAYQWAQRRKLEIHPKTGAAQLVEIREIVQEIVIPKSIEVELTNKNGLPLFANFSDEELLSYGVPDEWLEDVKNAREDNLLMLVDHLPGEAAEALLELATGGKPKIITPDGATIDPFDHPDALRRFRVMNNMDDLKLALDYPWEKWTIFLHPDQQGIVEYDFNGPARVSGSAGTGKTVVALHRAVFLAKQNPDTRVLLITFTEALANALRTKLRRLISNQPRIGDQLEVNAMNLLGLRLFEKNFQKPQIVSQEDLRKLIQEASQNESGHSFSINFLVNEWEQVFDAWQLNSWKDYQEVPRLGRKTRLPEAQRQHIWNIFEQVRSFLKTQGKITYAELYGRLTAHYDGQPSPYDFIIVDESQDLSVPQLRFLASLAKDQPNSLFFAGDLGQRIFQQPFSWKTLGVDIRGRSRTLRINYRTSHQIRIQADRLLGREVSDVDGIIEKRGDTISVFNGPKPGIEIFESQEEEINAVSQWLTSQIMEGMEPQEIGVFVRSIKEIGRGQIAIGAAGLSFKLLDEKTDAETQFISLSTMHLAKGLEFRAVVVMACDDEVIPMNERIENVTDVSDLEEVYNTERHLLYVACTRARDKLFVTGVEPASEFLDDLIN